MPEFNPAFAEYSTRVAFNLTLTRPQLQYLGVIARMQDNAPFDFSRDHRVQGYRDIFVPQVKGLISRGLVEHNEAVRGERSWPHVSWIYRLTPAGEHVVSLLHIAGLLEQVQPERSAA